MPSVTAEYAVATATRARYVLARPTAALARALLAFVAGALLAAAFAPLNLWPLAVLAPALLMWLWQGASPREAALSKSGGGGGGGGSAPATPAASVVASAASARADFRMPGV